MKPGKPLAFGHLTSPPRAGGKEGELTVPVLGLPGNPVSVMVSFETFVRPAIWKMLGRSRLARPTLEATLMGEIKRKDERRHYVRVRIEEQDGEHRAHLTGGQGSGILSSMVKAKRSCMVMVNTRSLLLSASCMATCISVTVRSPLSVRNPSSASAMPSTVSFHSVASAASLVAASAAIAR